MYVTTPMNTLKQLQISHIHLTMYGYMKTVHTQHSNSLVRQRETPDKTDKAVQYAVWIL